MKYLANDINFYRELASKGLLAIVFIKKSGELRVMLCSSNQIVISLFNCTSHPRKSTSSQSIGVVDVLIDRVSNVSVNKVLHYQFISVDEVLRTDLTSIYKIDRELKDKYSKINVNEILISNLD